MQLIGSWWAKSWCSGSRQAAGSATAPTSNGHAHLERLIEDVQSEAEPQAKPKRRVRRTKEEIEVSNSAKSAKQPVLVTVAIAGLDISGTPASLAAVIRELQHGRVAA